MVAVHAVLLTCSKKIEYAYDYQRNQCYYGFYVSLLCHGVSQLAYDFRHAFTSRLY